MRFVVRRAQQRRGGASASEEDEKLSHHQKQKEVGSKISPRSATARFIRCRRTSSPLRPRRACPLSAHRHGAPHRVRVVSQRRARVVRGRTSRGREQQQRGVDDMPRHVHANQGGEKKYATRGGDADAGTSRFGLFEQRERAVNGVNTRCDLSLRTMEVQHERIDRGSTAIVLRNAATFYISGLEPNLCFYPNTARATF